MSLAWDPQQREWLEAMGLQLWVRADPAERAQASEAPGPAVQTARAQAAALFAAPAAPAKPPLPTPARAGGDRLLRAVLRAAGRRPEDGLDPELAARVDLAALRADPAAKRALWPALRALRRRARG